MKIKIICAAFALFIGLIIAMNLISTTEDTEENTYYPADANNTITLNTTNVDGTHTQEEMNAQTSDGLRLNDAVV